MHPYQIALFASGNGTNAEAIISYFREHGQIQIAVILTNNPNAYVIERAKKLGIPYEVFSKEAFHDPSFVTHYLKKYAITHIVLAGFLWLIPPYLIARFPGKIINIHPALLPKFGGKGMYGMRVHQAVKDAQETKSGISIHEVDEIYDHGKIIAQFSCPIDSSDHPEDIANKIHQLEHLHFPETIEKWIQKIKN